MNVKEAIRLLVLNNTRSEVERLVSMLNNAGYPNRAQHAETEESLVQLLQDQNWDLLIASESSSAVTPLYAVRQIQRLNKDIPVIVISDEDETQRVVEGMKTGARDVVALDQDQHLLLVIDRELENRDHRYKRRLADRKLLAAEKRAHSLLDSSRNGIAFIQDGIFIYCNQSFAEAFGHEDGDDIECMPLIDMIADDDQDRVKQFFKDMGIPDDEDTTETLSFTGVDANGGPCEIEADVCRGTYDEETCLQLRLTTTGSANDAGVAKELKKVRDKDELTGLYNRHYFNEKLEKELSSNLNSQSASILYFIEIDSLFDTLQPKLGLRRADRVVTKVGEFLRQRCGDGETLAHFSDNTFTMISPEPKADVALERSSKLCQELEKHIIDIDSQSVQVTASIGLVVINETAGSADEILDHAKEAVVALRESKSGGNGCKLFEPKLPEDEAQRQKTRQLIENALEKDRFQLLFQPIISLRGSEDEHYEILLRLLDDNDHLLAPGQFMDCAEEIEALCKIDRWVILNTIKTVAEHNKTGNQSRVLINLSEQSVCDESLVGWVKVALEAADVKPETLIFQVDELSISNQLLAAQKFFQSIGEVGCQTSICNFGCSLNPFLNFNHVSPTYVKIHGSFTLDIQNNNESPEVLTNIIKQLLEENKITIVPFVENASVLSSLWQTGVHYIQGHYLQAPTESMSYDFNMEG